MLVVTSKKTNHCKMNITKTQIKKLGKSIRVSQRESNSFKDEDLEKLQAYRVSFQKSMNNVFDFLVARSKYHYKGSLTVYRLKRIDTIVRKINREKTMDFSKMQDIAGCRSIVDSERQIYNIVADFEKNDQFEIIDRVDYIIKPRDTGYVSYHLIVKPINEERFVEIQLRTRSQHFWATLVEITDVVFNIKLKEGEDHPQLYRFHKLLAKGKNQLTTEDKIEIVQIERENEIISKVTSLFKSNYYVSIDRWGKAENRDEAQYLIMELDEDLSPDFYFFKDFLNAESAYFDKFASNEPNMVLVHVNKPSFEKIGLAYSNYILTSHPSIRLYVDILQGLILNFKSRNKQSETEDYLSYYSNMIDVIIESFHSEIDFMNKKIEDNQIENIGIEEDKRQYLRLIREWSDNMSRRLNFISNSDQDFYDELESFSEVKTARKGILGRITDYLLN